MHRVLVIGPCGAGKSTASHQLSRLLNLPLHHLDKMHWNPGWVEGSKTELLEELAPIIATDRWLIDGNYGSTMEPRLRRADTVVYLDYPIRICFWRALRRVWTFKGETRPDMAQGCPERFDLEFFLYILNWNRHARPKTERLLKGTAADILRFRHPRELREWIENLEKL